MTDVRSRFHINEDLSETNYSMMIKRIIVTLVTILQYSVDVRCHVPSSKAL